VAKLKSICPHNQKLHFKTDAEYIDVAIMTSIREESIPKIRDGTAAPPFATFVEVFLEIWLSVY